MPATEQPPQFTKGQQQEISEIVCRTIDDYLKKKAATSKNLIITIATIIVGLTVILGALKALLAWLGFSYVKP